MDVPVLVKKLSLLGGPIRTIWNKSKMDIFHYQKENPNLLACLQNFENYF